MSDLDEQTRLRDLLSLSMYGRRYLELTAAEKEPVRDVLEDGWRPAP